MKYCVHENLYIYGIGPSLYFLLQPCLSAYVYNIDRGGGQYGKYRLSKRPRQSRGLLWSLYFPYWPTPRSILHLLWQHTGEKTVLECLHPCRTDDRRLVLWSLLNIISKRTRLVQVLHACAHSVLFHKLEDGSSLWKVVCGRAWAFYKILFWRARKW